MADKENFKTPGRINIDELHREQISLKEAQKASKIDPKKNVFNAMSMFTVAMDFGLSLSIPLILAVFAGKWLNTKYHSKYFILILLPVAIFISAVAIYKQIKKLQESIKKK